MPTSFIYSQIGFGTLISFLVGALSVRVDVEVTWIQLHPKQFHFNWVWHFCQMSDPVTQLKDNDPKHNNADIWINKEG